MTFDNRKIAAHLQDIAMGMDIQGDRIRANAYGKAALNILEMKEDAIALSEEGRLTSIEGVGASIAKKIEELLRTGTTETFENLRNDLPEDLDIFRELPHGGSRLAAEMVRSFGVRSIEDLAILTRVDRLVEELSIDPALMAKLADHIRFRREEAAEIPTPDIMGSVRRVISYFLNEPSLKVIAFAGPTRRMVSAANNVTFLFVSTHPDRIISLFGLCPEVEELTMVERERSAGKLACGAICLIKAVSPERFFFELITVTGSEAHLNQLGAAAVGTGLTFTSNGLYRGKELVFLESENKLYEMLSFPYSEPEHREGRKNPLDVPERPCELSDLKGDLFVRSIYLRRKTPLGDIIFKAKELGLEYLCVCDLVGSKTGMDKNEMNERNLMIDSLSEETAFPLLKGAEIEIDAKGELEASDVVLEDLDLVVASVNRRVDMSSAEMTARVLKAMDDERMDALAHPTNRIIGLRQPSPIDMTKIAARARENKIALEINASPDRLDLNDEDIYKVYEEGPTYYIGTHAIDPADLASWKWGMVMARRGYLAPSAVLNCKHVDEMRSRRWRRT